MKNKPQPFLIRVLLRYFIQGLLFMIPLGIITGIFYYFFDILQHYAQFQNFWIAIGYIFVAILFFGWLSTSLIARPLYLFMEEVLTHAPLIKFLYTSLKDLTETFVGEKKKFDKPVLVSLSKDSNAYKLGFITRNDLEALKLPGMIAVYLPHSYNFSGNLYIVAKENCRPIDINPTETLKFVVSGGITGFREEEKEAEIITK